MQRLPRRWSGMRCITRSFSTTKKNLFAPNSIKRSALSYFKALWNSWALTKAAGQKDSLRTLQLEGLRKIKSHPNLVCVFLRKRAYLRNLLSIIKPLLHTPKALLLLNVCRLVAEQESNPTLPGQVNSMGSCLACTLKGVQSTRGWKSQLSFLETISGK